MSLLRYISHPNVLIDPDVPVPEWSLSEEGLRRARAMAAQPWTATIGRVISSGETKATMTADILADALGLAVEVRPETGEIDRSATGYITHERHEELADRLFGDPDTSADGWERAVDAKVRIVSALADVLIADVLIADELIADVLIEDSSENLSAKPDTAVIGHGGVGTLLLCHLGGLPIDRVHDQPGQGHYWTYDRTTGSIQHPWLAIDHNRPEGYRASTH